MTFDSLTEIQNERNSHLIVTMKKLLILGQDQYRETVLAKIQQVGVVHIQPLQEIKNQDILIQQENFALVKEAVAVLGRYPVASQNAPLQQTWLELAQQIQQLDKQLKSLEATRAEQENQLAAWEVWGNFSSELLQKLKSQGVAIRLWKCLSKEADQFKAEVIPWQKQVGPETFLITVSHQETVIAPDTAQEIIASQGPQELRQALDNTKKEINDCQETLQGFTPYLHKLNNYASELQDIIALTQAKGGLLQTSSCFGLQGWLPITEEKKLQECCRDLPVVLHIELPRPEEQPPTLMKNPRWIQSILDVVLIYATPGYQEWDPSVSVYFAFAIFFAMIVGDAGYGLVILSLMLWFRRRLIQSDVGLRVYRLFVTISTACIIYGGISGTWFAIDLNSISSDGAFFFVKYLQKLQLSFFDSANYASPSNYNSMMMLLAIYVGVIHLTIAKLVQMVRLWPKTIIIAELGWIVAMWSVMGMMHWQYPDAKYGMIGGLVLVLLFSSTSLNPIRRILEGILGLLGITQLFADVLSYLRLFALGLASMVLSSIFNKMGMEIHQAYPGILGYVLMVLVIFSGHSINLLLSIMGGFIHGLRLNFLEFYRYCFEGSGYLYQPLMLQHKVETESKS